jgi:hypothetical protein
MRLNTACACARLSPLQAERRSLSGAPLPHSHGSPVVTSCRRLLSCAPPQEGQARVFLSKRLMRGLGGEGGGGGGGARLASFERQIFYIYVHAKPVLPSPRPTANHMPRFPFAILLSTYRFALPEPQPMTPRSCRSEYCSLGRCQLRTGCTSRCITKS